MLKKYFKYTWLLTSILVMASILLCLQKKQVTRLASDAESDYYQQEKKLAAKVQLQKKIPDIGFSNLIADWSYLQFIQYFGDGKAREITGYSLIPEYFSVMVERDPYFVKAYLSLSAANSIYAAQPKKTVEFLNQILTNIDPNKFSYASYIWAYKAVDEILFLGDTKAAEKSYRMAADWASKQGDEHGDYMARRNLETADFLATNPDSKAVRIGAWSVILQNTHDDKTRRYVLDQIKALGAEIVINSQGQLEIRAPQKDYEDSSRSETEHQETQ